MICAIHGAGWVLTMDFEYVVHEKRVKTWVREYRGGGVYVGIGFSVDRESGMLLLNYWGYDELQWLGLF